MALKSSELNQLHKYKQKVRLIDYDIDFLKQCKKTQSFSQFYKDSN